MSCIALFHLRAWVGIFGLIPEKVMRYGGLTVLTSFFLHGSIWHLAVNMYFLLLFGDNVEEAIGVVRYVLLISLATIAGAVAHVMFDPRQNVPVIGASAAIAGIVAFGHAGGAAIGILFFLEWRFMAGGSSKSTH